MSVALRRNPARHERRADLTEQLSARVAETRLGRRYAQWRAVAATRTVRRHWTAFLGSPIAACVLLLLGTGIALTIFYVPSSEVVRYDGPYPPLAGVEMSRAYESTLRISFELPGGLLLRQIHHWAALLLPALLAVQLAATWFTGGNRRPRRLAWLLLCGAMGAALLGGWSGYALPDDLLAGTGMRIFQGILLGVPVVGTGLSSVLFGTGFPGHVLEVLALVHLLVAPALLVAFLGARLVLAWRMPGPRRSLRGDLGRRHRELPLLAAVPRALALAAFSGAAVVLIGATVTVAPVWVAGPSDPGSATAGSQPDWYTAFLDGALRLVPPGWEVELGGYTVTLALLVPLAVVGLFVAAIVVVPATEDRLRRDRRPHTVLLRPRDAPGRTGLGVAVLAFYLVLWSAAGSDVAAQQLRLGLEQVIDAHRVALLVGPIVAFVVARRICLDLRARDRDLLEHGVETGRVVRLSGGQYVEVHQSLDDATRTELAEALASTDGAPVQPGERSRSVVTPPSTSRAVPVVEADAGPAR